MKYLFALILSLWLLPAQATDRYYVDCGTGADAACAANIGSNGNPCTQGSPCQTYANALASINACAAGDRFFFAKGGAWNSVQGNIQCLSSVASNPIVMDAYTPTWCTGGCLTVKPILNGASGQNAIPFDDGATPEPDAGYVVQNLELRGAGTAAWGIFLSQLVSDVTIKNMTIKGFLIGVHCGLNIKRVQILYSTINDNSEQGILSGCDDSRIEGNSLDNNGFIAGTGEDDPHYHNIYLGLVGSSNVTVRGNTLTDNSRLTTNCRSPSFVVHGDIDGLLIENNYLFQSTTTMKGGCYGIAVDNGYPGTAEFFKNVIIRGNTIVNLGNAGIGCTSCINPVIENNVVVLEAPTGTGEMPEFSCIAVPDRDAGGEDAASTGSKIRNNSCYMYYGPASTSGISFGAASTSAGTNMVVANNLMVFASAVNSGHTCFNLGDRVLANFTAFVSNLCYHQGGTGRWSAAYASLAVARAAGFDTGAANLDQDPLLTALPTSGIGWAMKLNSGSPGIGTGNATYKAPTAIKGCSPTGARDIGAYQRQAGC